MAEPIDLDALEELAKAATPGPWKQGTSYGVTPEGRPNGYVYQVKETSHIWERVSESGLPVNAAFIAAADPSTVLALIARVREAEGRA